MLRLTQTFGAHSGRALELDQEVIRFGRRPDSDFAFDPHADLDASARHAEIRREGVTYLLVDVGSRNGTMVDGRRIDAHVLSNGDEIEFGVGGPRVRVEILEGTPVPRPSQGSSKPDVDEMPPTEVPLSVERSLHDPELDAYSLPASPFAPNSVMTSVPRADVPRGVDVPRGEAPPRVSAESRGSVGVGLTRPPGAVPPSVVPPGVPPEEVERRIEEAVAHATASFRVVLTGLGVLFVLTLIALFVAVGVLLSKSH